MTGLARRVALAAAAFGLLAASPATAAPGGLDGSFGKGGLVHVSLGDVDGGYGVVRTADGRVVVAGGVRTGKTSSLYLTRYLPNGRLDTSFGSRGVTRAKPGGALVAVELEQLPDGRLLAVGLSSAGVVVARFTSAGKTDTSYGKGGAAVVSRSDAYLFPLDAAAADDGSIAVVGVALDGRELQPFVTKIKADGTPDTGFAPGGTIVSSTGSAATATVAMPDGSVVVAGEVILDAVPVPYLTRYLANGLQDPTFGSAAFVSMPGTEISALARTREGFFVAAGVKPERGADGGNPVGAVMRFLPTGTLDPTFAGGNGAAHVAGGSMSALSSVAVLTDGRIVVAGVAAGRTLDLLAGRLTALGMPDTAYGKNGVSVQGTSARHEIAYDLAVGADGRVTTTGETILQRGRTAYVDTLTARFLP